MARNKRRNSSIKPCATKPAHERNGILLVMKITFDFENGMQLSLKPENIQLFDNGGQNTVLGTKTDQTVLPLLFFKTLLATEEEIKAREIRAEAKAAKEATASKVSDKVAAAPAALPTA